MTAALAGELKLVLGAFNNRIVAEELFHRGNMKLSARIPAEEAGTARYFIINTGGGCLEGERYRCSIGLKDSAKAIIMSQTPTYVYKCDHQEETACITELRLGRGACLEFLLDEIICYRNANFLQDTTVWMDKRATLIYSDGLTSGWSPDGLHFQYSRLRLKTRIFLDGRLAYVDNMHIAPAQYPMDLLGMFEGYRSYGSVIIFDARIDQEFLRQIRLCCATLTEEIRWGASLLEQEAGVLIRVLASSSQCVRQCVLRCVNYAREALLGLAPINMRKNEVAHDMSS